MKRLVTPIILILLLVSNLQLFAQPVPMKFGDIKLSDLKMETFEADPDASVVILGDYGSVDFKLARGYTEFKRHRRIKILNKAGFDWADINIQYYKDGGGVSNIKAVTYTLENGKMEEHKLNKKAIIDEKINENYSQKKISMPNIKEGAVIEYSFTIVSKNFGIPSWYFQTSEPTLYSEYRVKIPKYYEYANYYQGANLLTVNTDENYSNTETIDGKPFNYSGRYYRRVAENVPALREEPYMTTPDDYRAKVGYQLQAINNPGRLVKNIMEDWNKVAERLWEDEDFGLSLRGYSNSSVKKVVPDVIAKASTPKEKMVAIYDYVRQTMEWNGTHRFWTSQSLNNTFQEKKGNSGDINLMLTLMLREAALDALPAMISTRSHGKMQPIYPFLDQFNHTIVYVKIGEQEYWLDATHKYRPYNLLDHDDLNHNAFVVDKNNPEWKPLNSKQKFQHLANATFVLTEEGNLEGTFACSDKDYSAFYYRKSLKADGEKTFAAEMFKDDLTDMEMKSYEFENVNEVVEPLKSNYEMTINSVATLADKRMYLNPMLSEAMTENPFKLEVRTFPIDYGYGYSYTYIFNLELPEGYEIEELPEATRVALPNKGGSFMYNIAAKENTLQLMSKFSIKQTLFQPEEYPLIKQFYDMIVAKHAEQIVLKKAE